MHGHRTNYCQKPILIKDLFIAVIFHRLAKKLLLKITLKKRLRIVGGSYVLPDFSMIPIELKPEIKRSDFNDLFVLLMAKGLDRNAALDIVRQQLTIILDEIIMTQNLKDESPKSRRSIASTN